MGRNLVIFHISTHDLTKRSTIPIFKEDDEPWHFNSRPHEEVDYTVRTRLPSGIRFQLTTSRRGRHCIYRKNMIHHVFQLTTSRRGRLSAVTLLPAVISFQLTTSRRGRLHVRKCPACGFHFNSRPHEEVDINQDVLRFTANISTHDLTKRSTSIRQTKIIIIWISTHDLTKRSTMMNAPDNGWQEFQLTTSRRGRPE